MKKTLLAAATALSFFAEAQNLEGKLSSPAQTKEGKVIYERTMRMGNIRLAGGGSPNLPPELQAQMDRMPKSRTDQFELLFTPQHSIFQYLPNASGDGGENTFSGGGATIVMRNANVNEVAYVDFAKASRTDQREVMERNFVVSDTLTRVQWKLSDETKTILNFTARKATATSMQQRPRMTMENGEMKREMVNDTVKVVAWFTTDVPVPAGPGYVGQLPGLILELDVNNGQNVTKAIEFSPKVAANKIKEPSSGKRVTAEEFTKERDKLMEEMRKNMPAGNVIRMQ